MMDSGVKAADAEKAVKPHVTNNSGDNEWYTPPKYIAAARAVMGGIDLDPASNEHANRTVRAEVFYDEQIDGLQQPWSGRVWLNPPYERGLIESFCERLVDSDEVTQACVLVNNATDTGWFRTLADAADAVCFLTGRISFLKSDGARNKPLQGQAVLYFGDRVNDFVRIFDDEFGHTWRGLT